MGYGNAFSVGQPSVSVDFDGEKLPEGWYGVQVIAWADVDFEFNVSVFSEDELIQFYDADYTTQISTELDLYVPEESESSHDDDWIESEEIIVGMDVFEEEALVPQIDPCSGRKKEDWWGKICFVVEDSVLYSEVELAPSYGYADISIIWQTDNQSSENVSSNKDLTGTDWYGNDVCTYTDLVYNYWKLEHRCESPCTYEIEETIRVYDMYLTAVYYGG